MPTLEHEADEGDPVMENVQNKLRPLAESDEIQQAAEDAIEKVRKDGKLTIPANLRREVFRLHRNLGHPDLWTFLRALRHAQAKTEVIAWVRSEFKCPICEARQRPSLPRPGHLVRNLEFNNVVGVDVIFFDWKNASLGLPNVSIWNTVLAGWWWGTLVVWWLLPFSCLGITRGEHWIAWMS